MRWRRWGDVRKRRAEQRVSAEDASERGEDSKERTIHFAPEKRATDRARGGRGPWRP